MRLDPAEQEAMTAAFESAMAPYGLGLGKANDAVLCRMFEKGWRAHAAWGSDVFRRVYDVAQELRLQPQEALAAIIELLDGAASTRVPEEAAGVCEMEKLIGPRPTSGDRLAEYLHFERIWNAGLRFGAASRVPDEAVRPDGPQWVLSFIDERGWEVTEVTRTKRLVDSGRTSLLVVPYDSIAAASRVSSAPEQVERLRTVLDRFDREITHADNDERFPVEGRLLHIVAQSARAVLDAVSAGPVQTGERDDG